MTKLEDLLNIMARLRHPTLGCPWDKQQTFDTIIPYTIEEAYEVADAIERSSVEELKNELGDLLFQIVFLAQIAQELNHFNFDAVVTSITTKLIERHPNVFGTDSIYTLDAQNLAWETHKAKERKIRAINQLRIPTIFDEVPRALPAIMRANKLQRRASHVGFDWRDIKDVIDKVEEELIEVRQELDEDISENHQRISDEIGDLLFACINLARHAKVDPETALRHANNRFETRFRYIETTLAQQGNTLEQSHSEELERLWEEAKSQE